MSPREIMNELETENIAIEKDTERIPEIQSAPEEEVDINQDIRNTNSIEYSNKEYADAFPDWDLLPPQVEIRRVSHRHN